MGANRKPTDKLNPDSLRKNPQRAAARANEPRPKGPLGPPPAEFIAQGTEPGYRDKQKLLTAWRDLEAATADILITAADRPHFEMTARLLMRCRQPGATNSEFNTLRGYLSQLGLNPASRSLVNSNCIPTVDQEEQEWDQAAAGGDGLPVQ